MRDSRERSGNLSGNIPGAIPGEVPGNIPGTFPGNISGVFQEMSLQAVFSERSFRRFLKERFFRIACRRESLQGTLLQERPEEVLAEQKFLKKRLLQRTSLKGLVLQGDFLRAKI